MPPTSYQIGQFKDAIESYAFPSVYYKFSSGEQVTARSILDVEAEIGRLLKSSDLNDVKDGLANVLYWGYAQVPYRWTRIDRFRSGVTDRQLLDFQQAVSVGNELSLRRVHALKMPQFSGISFLSKVLTFLDPENYCVLDKQLLKIAEVPGSGALHSVRAQSAIPATKYNEAAYRAWRMECADISLQYFSCRYRIVDIERGFFNLVQTSRLSDAQIFYFSLSRDH